MSRPQIKKARDRAKQIQADFSIIEPGTNIDKIASSFGLKVNYSALDDEISGMIFFKDGSTIVGVNSKHSENRQRFTLAHECGHFVLHRDKIIGSVHVDKKYPGLLRSDLSSLGIDPIEIEANQFAAELLVPEKLLLKCVSERELDVEDDALVKSLAKKFRVSVQMMSNCLANIRAH